MQKRRPYSLALLTSLTLLTACQASASYGLRIVVPSGRQAQALQEVASRYQQQTNVSIHVESFETATFDYSRKIEASLISNDGAYDLIYLPAERVMEFRRISRARPRAARHPPPGSHG